MNRLLFIMIIILMSTGCHKQKYKVVSKEVFYGRWEARYFYRLSLVALDNMSLEESCRNVPDILVSRDEFLNINEGDTCYNGFFSKVTPLKSTK